MTIKVYGAALSTNTVRVLTCLREKQVDFELVHVDLFKAEQRLPHFLAKNPFGQIPVLEDGDLILFESRAITTYIAEKFKETGYDLIRYQDPKEAALVKVWVEVESQQYNPAIKPIIYQNFVMPLMGKSPDQTIIDASIEKLGNVLDVYEAKLISTKYLAGDFYSLADLHHLPYTYYLMMKTPYTDLINQRPHVKAWWEDISSRPAFKKLTESMILGDN
ncbi:GST_C domain-containing protein/GST_N_3 domain-containing protein [Cephalotus follicularis]|uniref:glutathione transferase n=1 Tax=Cephalotus follicularis TaxID=3775 RepID=A0A1Q3D9G8_CEPFO|nr:GST_C domain-containing protein/GST_N_3 domain-containing protein [Cephalotus follicularis]